MFKRKFSKRKNKMPFLILLLLSLAVLFLHFKFRPIIRSVSMGRAKIISTDAVNEAVLEELSENKEEYKEIVKMEKLGSGELSAISSDMEKVNKLKSRVGLKIQNKLSNFKDGKIKIPIGTLSGMEIFGGLGPKVTMKILVGGNVSTEFKTSFKDAGINQTIYQIYLYVHTKICVMVPGCSCCEDFDTNVLVSEMIVLGNVPKVYSSQGGISTNFQE